MQSNESRRLDALTNAFNTLLRNQDLLQERLARLEKLLNVQAAKRAPEPVKTEAIAAPALAASEAPAIPETVAEAEVADAPARVGRSESTLESKVGLTVVNRIGAITLVLGVAFFFKWAVDNNWIGPSGRVMLGLLAGFATLAAGDFIWRKGQQVFAQGITVTGIAIIYLSIYAAFDFYHLIPQAGAFLAMLATTAMAAVLALRYKSFAIAALGLAAGYLTPLLLSTGQDHPWFLFSYLLLLNFAGTELGRRGEWPRLELISFAATALIYGGWLAERGRHEENRLVATLAPLAFTAQRWRTQTPALFSFSQLLTAVALAAIWLPQQINFALLALVVAFAGLAFAQWRNFMPSVASAFAGFWIAYTVHSGDVHEPSMPFLGIACGFLLFLAWSWWHLVRLRATPSTLALSVFSVNGIVFYALSYDYLHASQHLWLGPLAAVVAGVYLAFGIFLQRRAAEANGGNRPVLLALGIAVSFLTLAIPIQFTGFTITIAWAMQAAALTWIAQRLNNPRGVLAAVFIFALVVGRLLLFETETLSDPASYALLWNSRFLTFACSAVAMLLSAYWAAKILARAALATYFSGHIVLLWGVCLEIFGWAARSATAENRLSIETITVSIVFALYAVTLVSVGVATRTAINRLSGLCLIGIVILKLYFFDVWQLSRPYQISAFVVLGILLLSTSFLYSHFRRLIETWWKDDKTAA